MKSTGEVLGLLTSQLDNLMTTVNDTVKTQQAYFRAEKAELLKLLGTGDPTQIVKKRNTAPKGDV